MGTGKRKIKPLLHRYCKMAAGILIIVLAVSGCRNKKSVESQTMIKSIESAESRNNLDSSGNPKQYSQEKNEENQPQSPVTPQDLLEAQNPYLGDASANGKLLKLIWGYYGLKPGWSMELQTTDRPYGMTLHLDQEPDNITMQKAAGLLMGLIDNCYSVSWDYPADQQGNRAYFSMSVFSFEQYKDIGWIKDYLWQEDGGKKIEEFLAGLEKVDQVLTERTRARTLDQAVAAAIFEENRYIYPQGSEAYGEGHRLLGQEETENTAVVYALTMYGAYQFQDGNFVKNGGTGVLPVVIQMGREAVVGDYRDFPHTLLTEVGVPVEVSNALGDTRDLAPDDPARFAPSWLGNIEQLEDGERYIYEQSYDEEKKEIRFSKICYETGEIVGQSVYDGLTGKKIKIRFIGRNSTRPIIRLLIPCTISNGIPAIHQANMAPGPPAR